MQRDRSVSPRTAPPPLLRSFDQPRAHGIAFDVPTDREEILVRFDRKRFEAALIDMALSHRVAMLMPPLRYA